MIGNKSFSKGIAKYIIKKEITFLIIGIIVGAAGVIAAQNMGYIPCF